MKAASEIWVIGKGEAFWSGDEGARMTLVASKPTYQPGDTARLVAQANLIAPTALVTIERDGVIDARVQRMASAGEGIISVASNEVPRLMRQMVDERSVAIMNRLLPLLTGNFIESNPGPVKAAMKMMGILESDTVRSPLAPVTEANRKKLEAILRECGLEVVSN